MDSSNHQLFMFTHLSGVLAGILTFNSSEIVFENGTIIRMDPESEIINIDNHNGIFAKNDTLSFRACTLDKLKELGFKERPANERHALSYDNIPIHYDR